MADYDKKIYGIDLGTTYSCIATVVAHGLVDVLMGENGTRLTRSVVGFQSDGTPVVGDIAKALGQLNDPNIVVIESIKGRMGENIKIPINGRNWGPEPISALILRKLIKQAAISGHTVEDVVITVPASFGALQREATLKAGQMAGLNVLELIDEPIAAAVTYAEQIGKNDEVVLVYDLGGGTFDACVVKNSDPMTVFCSNGDRHLGGEIWDQEFAGYLISEWGGHNNIPPAECLIDRSNKRRDAEFTSRAEVYKRQLTGLQQISCDVHYDGKMASIPVNRELFNEMTEVYLERTIQFCEQSLDEAERIGVERSEISRILLVGGSSYMPQVKAALEQNFDIPIELYLPEEAVCRGAALYGYKKYRQSITPVNNISYKSFGLTYHDPDTNENYILWHIPSGSAVPHEQTTNSETIYENQRTTEFKIVESEGYDIPEHQDCDLFPELPDGVTEIGTIRITRPKEIADKLPKGSPMSHDIYLSDDGGMLRIDTEDKASGVKDLVEINNLHVSNDGDVQEWHDFLEGLY